MAHVISMDFDSMKGIRGEANETSSGTTEEVQTQNIAIETTKLEERFKTVMEARKNAGSQSRTPKIQKVVFLLRDLRDHEDFKKYFEPRMVSLGPIHYGKENYQLAEKHKLVLTSEFIKDSGKTMQEVYKKVEENIKELRECFEEEVTKDYDDEALAWLLFVDGCAILQYIYCATDPLNKKFKELSIKHDSVAFGHQDLFLLENQLPYRLLEWLMSLSEMKKKLEDSINEFIKRFVRVPKDQHSNCCLNWLSKKLWQRVWKQDQAKSEDIGVPKPIHLLDKLRTSLLAKHGGQGVNKNDPTTQNEDWQSYRNVQELQAAGIYLKRSKNDSLSLSDIYFSTLFPCFGFLWLPPIKVDDSTGPKFFNLIAYEMCLDFDNDYGVTSYISFLDSLIDEANDVKELRKAGVLQNFLGSDQEVAQLFNEIGNDLVPNPEIYSKVRSSIQKYYKNMFLTWTSQVIHDHFSSPWTIIAFIAAVFALILSTLQTWYTVPWLNELI
ncbi:hypothetical protein RGQ29_024542 [Quercus rubra]|uniref:Uncharacterized protein n=1 Tax=Quercus rubra TaxID=3512 RepID=A0AAN7EVP8_QUERU|nr:hypothetical protein RGQ29_024542 [Quercus rubra]